MYQLARRFHAFAASCQIAFAISCGGTPPPQASNASSATDSVSLDMAAISGSECPGYKVTIARSGAVVFEGRACVKAKGAQNYSVDAAKTSALFDWMRRIGVESWDAE